MSDSGDDEALAATGAGAGRASGLAAAGAGAGGTAGLAAAGAGAGGTAGLAAAGAGAAGAVDLNMDEEQNTDLPVLSSIWECPKINKITGFDDSGKPFSGWTCGWCPLEHDGSQPKPFRSTNATKALVHVAKVSGYDIRPCRGRIPAEKSKQYRDLHLSKALSKEERKGRKDTLGNSIADMQDRTLFALAEGAKKSSRHAL